MLIIEEMVLFPEPQPVQHIELDPQRVNHNPFIPMQTHKRAVLCQFNVQDFTGENVGHRHILSNQAALLSYGKVWKSVSDPRLPQSWISLPAPLYYIMASPRVKASKLESKIM